VAQPIAMSDFMKPPPTQGMAASTEQTNCRRSILGWWQDPLLFVATPFAVLGSLALARAALSPQEILLYAVAFDASLRHLPVLWAAYRDCELRRRYRLRLAVAPLAILTVCLTLGVGLSSEGFSLALLLWGAWHGISFVARVMRYYARRGPAASAESRLDLAMCLAWFGVGIVFSPARTYELLAGLYRWGVPVFLWDSFPFCRFAGLRLPP